MADLTIRRGGGGGQQQQDFDPFRMMREQMRRMQDVFRGDLFNEMEPTLFGGQGWVPDFEVRDCQGSLLLRADVPGVREEDLDITVIGNRLRITGKRELEQDAQNDTWYTAERDYGSFTRTFVLPEGIDTENVNAHLDNGVLTLRLNKRAESQPRRIALGRPIEGQLGQGGQQGAQGGQQGVQGGQQGYQGGQQGYPQQGYGQVGQQPYGGQAGGETGQPQPGKKVTEKV